MSFFFTFKTVMRNTRGLGYPFHKQMIAASVAAIHTVLYKIKLKMLKWNLDNEGDITLSVCNILHMTKYKESTIFRFGRKNYRPAPKHITVKPDN
jgi:hypothetical protein